MLASDDRPCPACLATPGLAAGAANGFELLRCRACGTLHTARLPGQEEATEYDEYYGPANLEIPGFVRESLDRVVGGLERYRETNRWLDVGCGAGTMLEAASAGGWDATGTEIAASAVEPLRERGLDVLLGELAELDLAPASFDVVSVLEVVEHLANPGELLRQAAVLLRPGGAIYLTTPHGRGVSARRLGSSWTVVAPPEHLQLFSVKGVRTLVRRAGLSAGSLRTHGVNPHELLRRGGGRAGPTPTQRVQSGYRLNESLSASRRGAVVKRVANSVLDVTRLGDSIKLVAVRNR